VPVIPGSAGPSAGALVIGWQAAGAEAGRGFMGTRIGALNSSQRVCSEDRKGNDHLAEDHRRLSEEQMQCA